MVNLHRIMKSRMENKVKMTKIARCDKRKAILKIELKYILGKIEYTKMKSRKAQKEGGKNMKKRLISALLTAAMVAVPFASVAEATSGATTIAGTPREETLVVEGLDGVISNPGQSNPYMSGTNFSRGLHQLVYSNLWEMDTIQGTQIADLAAELPEALNDDYTSFKVTLTEGIKWSDGEDFDAEDVVFTFNELLRLKDELPKAASFAGIVESVEYVDKYEVRIRPIHIQSC